MDVASVDTFSENCLRGGCGASPLDISLRWEEDKNTLEPAKR